MDGPRACFPDELPALLEAANGVFRPAGGDMGNDYPLLFSPANLANLRIIKEAGAVIAHAGLCLRRAALDGASIDVGALGAVFTRDGHRDRGLATAVVGDALAQARAAGAALALVSGDGPLYRRLGFSPVPPLACWECPAQVEAQGQDHARPAEIAAQGAGQTGIQVTPCRNGDADGDGDIPTLARLNDAEPLHFVRTAADWRALLDAATLFAWPARVWIVRRQGQPVGYLAVAQRARRRVLELAGDRRAVLAAAPLVSDELVAPWHDQEIARDARQRGWSERVLTLAMGSQWLRAPTGADWPLPWYGLNYV